MRLDVSNAAIHQPLKKRSQGGTLLSGGVGMVVSQPLMGHKDHASAHILAPFMQQPIRFQLLVREKLGKT
eukprot:CAMPEP_0115493638 /NCGR_PEP_ID=MMETSP0271-20121206/64298_1 /TAXON_ID=71861 /ORGANISM="Scrippsiella trochoidea, Strain CCMP3099" /LENGTH=69 /DNA_ID=CAMNT_0002922173 /DNA_START=1040 /DNA_END=1249 /DNA_ORIENTATION=+